MSYSSFTLSKLRQQFGLQQKVQRLFQDDIASIQPSQRLLDDLKEGQLLPTFSEKAKSELLITPIIKEVRRNNPSFTFFSGFAFNVDEKKGLTGHPDFLLTARTDIAEIEAPVFFLVEAKNRAIEEAYGQCGAELYAARIYNKNDGKDTPILYGVVTNAFDWVFMKLENNTIFIDNNRYYLKEVPKLLGIFRWIVSKYNKIDESTLQTAKNT